MSKKETNTLFRPKPKNIYTQRRQKKRRKILRQGIWFLLLVMAVLVLYQRRDSWFPKLETIGLRHQSNRYGDAASDGDFPLYVAGSGDCQIASAGKKLFVLSDSYLNLYETNGTQISARQHTYGNAMLRTAGDYALIYESGGTHFRLETPAKTVFEKTVNDPIIFGRISENGLIAVVTSAETCACKMLVFNIKGQQIYERSCVEDLIDVAFHPDEGGCFAATLHMNNGILQSVIHSYSFSQSEDIWSSKPLDMLAVSVYNTEEGNIFVLGDSQACTLSPEGAVLREYVYPDALVRGTYAEGTCVLLLANNEKRTKTVVILKTDGREPQLRSYDSDIKDIGLYPEKEAVLLQFRNQVEMISYSGDTLQQLPVSDSYEGFGRIGSFLFMRGYGKIDRLELQD